MKRNDEAKSVAWIDEIGIAVDEGLYTITLRVGLDMGEFCMIILAKDREGYNACEWGLQHSCDVFQLMNGCVYADSH